jgi:SAM-dependent methyltransferase
MFLNRLRAALERRSGVRAGNGSAKLAPSPPPLDFVSITMARNEQDIIEPFVRHHAGLMDLMFILDNRSTDRTRRILHDLARELGNVIVTDCPEEGYNQARIMTDALQCVQSAVFADYVFLLDADEFLPTQDPKIVREALRAVPKAGMGLMPWKTFVPAPDASEASTPEPLDRLQWSRLVEAPQYYKAVLRAGGGLVPDLQVIQGNHSIADAAGDALPSVTLETFPLYHMPLRSCEQLAAKGLIGWQANVARIADTKRNGEASQWKRLHDLVKTGTRPTESDLSAEAVNYAQDVPATGFDEAVRRDQHGVSTERRYSDGRFGKAEALLADAGRVAYKTFPVPERPRSDRPQTDIANAFDSDWHWELLFVDVPPMRWIIDKEQPKSILDLGCGSGLYPRLYQHLGVSDVLGVDGLDLKATVLDDRTYREFDLQTPFDAGRRFDLVICLEVLEHLFPDASDTLLDSIASHADSTILFSMAEPDQPGNGHINCLSIDAVLRHWEKRGWYPDLAQTLAMRALSSMAWFRRNLLVLRQNGDRRYPDAADRLRRIGRLRHTWYGQESGVRAFAFREPVKRSDYGYGALQIRDDG